MVSPSSDPINTSRRQIHIHKVVGYLTCVGKRWYRSEVTVVWAISIAVVIVIVGIWHSDIERSSMTGFAVSHQHGHRHPPRAGQLQTFILALSLTLVPPVLEPYFDLCWGELQHVSQVVSLGCWQVSLLLEASFQLKHLSLREEHSRFPALPLLWFLPRCFLFSTIITGIVKWTHTYLEKNTINKWRIQMQKPLSAIWNVLLKLAFFSGSHV